jgi:hypothetical protein
MSISKNESTQAGAFATIEHRAAESRADQIYRGDGAVLLEIGTRDKELGEDVSNLKFAADGHVC